MTLTGICFDPDIQIQRSRENINYVNQNLVTLRNAESAKHMYVLWVC